MTIYTGGKSVFKIYKFVGTSQLIYFSKYKSKYEIQLLTEKYVHKAEYSKEWQIALGNAIYLVPKNYTYACILYYILCVGIYTYAYTFAKEV